MPILAPYPEAAAMASLASPTLLTARPVSCTHSISTASASTCHRTLLLSNSSLSSAKTCILARNRKSQLQQRGEILCARAAAAGTDDVDFEGLFFSSERGSDAAGNGQGRYGQGSLSLLDGDASARDCPPGLRPYETMVIIRPDITEQEKAALTNRYEETLVAGGGMCVEAFNRGLMPLSYAVSKRMMSGEKKTFTDGIYLLFTYFTKPEAIASFEKQLKLDDDVIRIMTFKIEKKKG